MPEQRQRHESRERAKSPRCSYLAALLRVVEGIAARAKEPAATAAAKSALAAVAVVPAAVGEPLRLLYRRTKASVRAPHITRRITFLFARIFCSRRVLRACRALHRPPNAPRASPPLLPRRLTAPWRCHPALASRPRRGSGVEALVRSSRTRSARPSPRTQRMQCVLCEVLMDREPFWSTPPAAERRLAYLLFLVVCPLVEGLGHLAVPPAQRLLQRLARGVLLATRRDGCQAHAAHHAREARGRRSGALRALPSRRGRRGAPRGEAQRQRRAGGGAHLACARARTRGLVRRGPGGARARPCGEHACATRILWRPYVREKHSLAAVLEEIEATNTRAAPTSPPEPPARAALLPRRGRTKRSPRGRYQPRWGAAPGRTYRGLRRLLL